MVAGLQTSSTNRKCGVNNFIRFAGLLKLLNWGFFDFQAQSFFCDLRIRNGKTKFFYETKTFKKPANTTWGGGRGGGGGGSARGGRFVVI